ncbi:hypothetical protein OH76DRAFT_19296 [Lentinus brumalis]|uniref:Uncharacterized protein n=1 Tax=Lentinus brumalis TaxID=2498619 RepID=A0A371DXB3_9APHY|nr:hypothetical protein OH76DRAFT_19296 [Polyporus brumalis]
MTPGPISGHASQSHSPGPATLSNRNRRPHQTRTCLAPLHLGGVRVRDSRTWLALRPLQLQLQVQPIDLRSSYSVRTLAAHELVEAATLEAYSPAATVDTAQKHTRKTGAQVGVRQKRDRGTYRTSANRPTPYLPGGWCGGRPLPGRHECLRSPNLEKVMDSYVPETGYWTLRPTIRCWFASGRAALHHAACDGHGCRVGSCATAVEPGSRTSASFPRPSDPVVDARFLDADVSLLAKGALDAPASTWSWRGFEVGRQVPPCAVRSRGLRTAWSPEDSTFI